MPTLTQRFEKLGGLIKAVIALLALLPGVAVLAGLIDIPPTLVELVKALSVFVGIALLVAMALLSPVIRRLRSGVVVLITVGAVIVGAGFAIGYRSFADSHLVLVESDGEVQRYVVPLAPSEAIGRLVQPYGGDYAEALMTSARREKLIQLMDRESGSSIALMVTLMLVAQTLLVGGVALGGWKLALTDESPSAPPRKRAARPRSQA